MLRLAPRWFMVGVLCFLMLSACAAGAHVPAAQLPSAPTSEPTPTVTQVATPLRQPPAPPKSSAEQVEPTRMLHLPLTHNASTPELTALPLILSNDTPEPVTAEDDSALEPLLAAIPRVAALPDADTLRQFVRAEGGRLMLDGEPYFFLGTNTHYLTRPYFPEREIEPIIKYLAETGGVNVLRFWILPEDDNVDRLEYILDLGRKYNVRFIIALQNYHFYKSQTWFDVHYKEIDLPHAREVVARFRDRPEVLMWELMNEPGCGPEAGNKACNDVLYRWAEHVSSEIKAIDPYHLISIGTTFRGWTEYEKANYDRMHALPTIDVVSIHRRVGKASRGEMRLAEQLNKPVFVGEAYFRAYDAQCRPVHQEILNERARAIAEDLDWSFKHGLDGYLVWEHLPGRILLDDGSYTTFCEVYGFFEGDPLYDVLADYLPAILSGERVDTQPVGPGDD